MNDGDEVRAISGPARDEALLSVRDVTKAFPGLRALDRVSMDIHPREVHALCGGNGSGKSTLVKILSGVARADGGFVRVGNREVEAAELGPKLSREMGVRVVHQDLALFPDMSVAENMMLGAGIPVSRLGAIRWRQLRRQTCELIDRFEIAVKPATLVRELPVATRTQVAIARTLQDVDGSEGLLILDEATAALPVHEVGLLLAYVERLAAAGQAILFVSHRLDEVLSVSQRVTVLRDGRVFAEHETGALTEAELISAITGSKFESEGSASRHRAEPAARDGAPLLSVRDLAVGPLTGVHLEAAPGEILGIAGLLGSGRTELLRAIYGDLKPRAGTVIVGGEPANFSHVEQAIARGVVLIPEDRAESALFADLSVDENLNVSVLREYWRGLGFRRSRLRDDAAALRKRFSIRAVSGSVEMKALSGGNQQKGVLARWLRREPVLLLMDEATQGVDVGARSDIWKAVRKVVDAGGAALIVLSDLEELAQVADRAIVLRDGIVSAEVSRDELTAQRLTELIYEEASKHD